MADDTVNESYEVSGEISDLADESAAVNGVIGLPDVMKIVNSVVDNCFHENNGVTNFNSEYYEVLKAYWKLSYFFPSLKVIKLSIFEFFDVYIAGKYDGYLDEIADNRLSLYIDGAIDKKIKFKISQIQNPIIPVLTNLLNTVNSTIEKYSENIESADLKNMIGDFANFTKKNNPETITNAVLKRHVNKIRKEKSSGIKKT